MLINREIVLIIAIYDDTLIGVAVTVDLLLSHNATIKTKKTLVHQASVLLLLYHVISKHVVPQHVASVEPEETCIHAFVFAFVGSGGRRLRLCKRGIATIIREEVKTRSTATTQGWCLRDVCIAVARW